MTGRMFMVWTNAVSLAVFAMTVSSGVSRPWWSWGLAAFSAVVIATDLARRWRARAEDYSRVFRDWTFDDGYAVAPDRRRAVYYGVTDANFIFFRDHPAPHSTRHAAPLVDGARWWVRRRLWWALLRERRRQAHVTLSEAIAGARLLRVGGGIRSHPFVSLDERNRCGHVMQRLGTSAGGVAVVYCSEPVERHLYISVPGPTVPMNESFHALPRGGERRIELPPEDEAIIEQRRGMVDAIAKAFGVPQRFLR